MVLYQFLMFLYPMVVPEWINRKNKERKKEGRVETITRMGTINRSLCTFNQYYVRYTHKHTHTSVKKNSFNYSPLLVL
jgi:hypothetical protein